MIIDKPEINEPCWLTRLTRVKERNPRMRIQVVDGRYWVFKGDGESPIGVYESVVEVEQAHGGI